MSKVRVPLDCVTLDYLLKERGFTQKAFADACDISLRSVTAAKKKEEATLEMVKLFANTLGVEPDVLIRRVWIDDRVGTRSVQGHWKGCSIDLELPPYLKYEITPQQLEIEAQLSQSGSCVSGECIVKGAEISPVRLRGHCREDGNIILLEYQNFRREFAGDYGHVVLSFDSYGKKLTGFFMGREINHSPKSFVLARIELEKV